MKDPARLQAVITLLTEIEAAARPADASVSAFFRSRRFIGAKDRKAIADMAYDCIRHHAKLRWWLGYLDKKATVDAAAPVDFRRLLLLYTMLVKNQSASNAARLFTGEPYAPAMLDAGERDFVNGLTGRTLLHPQMDEATQSECPAWAYPMLKAAYGSGFKAEMAALLKPAPSDVRINPLKTTREAVLEALHKEGMNAEPTPLSPLGIRVQGRPALAQLDLYKNGAIEIQDEGSQLIALLVDAKPGQAVVDFCAGAGGKTLALAAMMENKGRVIACDVLEKRLEKAKLRFRRAGLHNIDTRVLVNEKDQWIKHSAGKYDRVLVDAPCSGSGTWRRNPDAKWKMLGPSLASLRESQKNILAAAARLVKNGGRLIYATCSLLAEENQQQVETFLAEHPSFRLVPVASILPALTGDTMQQTPAQHQTDGFFCAVLVREG